jgi:hypothetical protein
MPKVKETALIGGRFKLGKAGGRAPTDFMGLVSTAQEQIEQTEIRLQDTTSPQGGTYDTFSRVDRFFINMGLREINSRNLANALYADIAEVPSTAVTGEDVVLGVGQTTALALMPLEITKVAIDGDEYDEDIDWRMTGAGIEVIEDSDLADFITTQLSTKNASSTPKAGGNAGNGTMGAVTVGSAAVGAYFVSFTSSTAFNVTGPGGAVGTGTAGTPFSTGGLSFTITAGATPFAAGDGFSITVVQATEVVAKVDYTSAAFDEIELLTNSGEEWYLLMEGANAVGEKGKFNAHYWRVKFSPTESRDVIGNEDFMTMNVRAEVLREDSRATGDAKSAYGKLQKQRLVA